MSLPSAGGLRVRDVGPRGHRHHRGPANCWRPLQHQGDSPEEEEQLQTPEEEGQAAGGQYPKILLSCFLSLLWTRHMEHVSVDLKCKG